METLLARAERIRQQQPRDSNKLYSLHEPDVRCISKGKAHKRYEFGQKVAIATTNRGNWLVAAQLLKDNPYDGHTLRGTLAAVEAITGVAVTDAYVDKGYRGHGIGKDEGGAACAAAVHVHIAGQRRKSDTRAVRQRRQRRSAVEPKIGHLKSDNRLDRCFLAGLSGDAINAVLAAAGSNFSNLLQRFEPLRLISILPALLFAPVVTLSFGYSNMLARLRDRAILRNQQIRFTYLVLDFFCIEMPSAEKLRS